MVMNHYVKCGVCNAKFRLRAQIGYSDISIDYHCPVCETQITGIVKIPDNPQIDKKNLGIEFIINNAIEYHPSRNFADYVVELSTEFLQQRIAKDNEIGEMTPFIRTYSEQGEKGIKNIDRLRRSLNYLNRHKNDLKIISDLWNRNKIKLLINKVNDLDLTKTNIQSWEKPDNFRVKTTIEMLMVVHQSRISLLSSFWDSDRRSRILNYPNTFTEIENSIGNENISNFAYLLGNQNYYKDFEKRIHEITLIYIDILPDIIPLLNSLDLFTKDLNSGKYTITNKHVFSLINLYAKSYELYCDKIDLVIGLNNLNIRGNLNHFCNSRIKGEFIKITKSLSKYRKVKELLCIFDTYSSPYIGKVSNKIRNSEGHFSREFNIKHNSIEFKNSYKNNYEIIEVDYLEFTGKVIELFHTLNELFEVSYQMDKIFRIIKGEYMQIHE